MKIPAKLVGVLRRVLKRVLRRVLRRQSPASFSRQKRLRRVRVGEEVGRRVLMRSRCPLRRREELLIKAPRYAALVLEKQEGAQHAIVFDCQS
jgi:hypothetical protein